MSVSHNAKKVLAAGLEKALVVQQPMAKQNVVRLRRVHPQDTPRDTSRRLKQFYLTAVTASGGAAGAAGAIPGIGVPAALADVLAYTEASVLYTLSLTEVHGLHPEDIERRKLSSADCPSRRQRGRCPGPNREAHRP